MFLPFKVDSSAEEVWKKYEIHILGIFPGFDKYKSPLVWNNEFSKDYIPEKLK